MPLFFEQAREVLRVFDVAVFPLPLPADQRKVRVLSNSIEVLALDTGHVGNWTVEIDIVVNETIGHPAGIVSAAHAQGVAKYLGKFEREVRSV